MIGRISCRPMDPTHPTGCDFVFAAQGAILLAHRDRSLPTVPATDDTADKVLARLGEITREVAGRRTRRNRTGRPVVCGMIPFDPAEPADLFITERPVWLPRPRRTGPVALAQELVIGPLKGDREYQEAVAEALDRIDRGAAQHLVLARALDLDLPHGLGAAQVWDQLLARISDGYAFSVRPSGGGVFLGSGPDLTAEVRPTGFACHLITGAVPRRLTVAGEAATQEALLRTPSARGRHQHAVDHITDALGPFTVSMAVPERPSVVGTDASWHLGTRITGRLHRGTSALHAALVLHPTPAVGGSPRKSALSLIRELEPCRRGYYAGLVGWTDAAGHGQWVPALRCALFDGPRVRVYAGSELAPGTTADTAEQETSAASSTIRAALAATQHHAPATTSAATATSVGNAA